MNREGLEMSAEQGLSSTDAGLLLKQFGSNLFEAEPEFRLFRIFRDIVTEPMFILLAIACALYFILGDNMEGVMMAVAIGLVTAVSFFQEVKTSHALRSLQQLTEPRVTVIRDGQEQVILNAGLVPGDVMLLEEGMKVPADASILFANDFSVNESVITGESLPVTKSGQEGLNALFQGSTINSGKCIAKVTATGNRTTLGKIGKTISGYHPPKTMLQVQLNRFVARFALFGLLGFLVIFVINYLHYGTIVTSLLFALTLAMSAIPEEIPVAFSSFMALGAFKMSKLGIISRQPQVIENLGAVNVLCLDKTGTITENSMVVKLIYDYATSTRIEIDRESAPSQENVLLFATLASEFNPFDPMERAIVEAYQTVYSNPTATSRPMAHEYPLNGQPPMMTHVYQRNGSFLAAGKGATERILAVCRVGPEEKERIIDQTRQMAMKGYRVLGVCSAELDNDHFPERQDDFNWTFRGLVALYDPPRKDIGSVLQKIASAGISIKMMTGDYPETAINIARQVGISNDHRSITGDAIMAMDDQAIGQAANNYSVFARMFPEAKVRVINALKTAGNIVAMTGDGVNDGPALKLADIGIAMGKRGTETARLAADLVLTDDNLERIVTAISEGRKIFNNFLKAIRYIISIHIPIILTASLPLILGWKYPNIFTPIHVIFLELIMGPTCSIFFEREPVEDSLMLAPPRKRKGSLFSLDEVLISVTQGLIITAGVLGIYYFNMASHSLEVTRTMVFNTLTMSNVFLTFVNRSFTQNLFYTSRYKNNLAIPVILTSCIFLVLLNFVPFVRNFFQLTTISPGAFWLCLGTAFVSVMWFEIYKTGLSKTA